MNAEPDDDDDRPTTPEHMAMMRAWKQENCRTIDRLIEVIREMASVVHDLTLYSDSIDKRTALLRLSETTPDPADPEDEFFHYPEARVAIRDDGLAVVTFMAQAETKMVNNAVVEDLSDCTVVIISPIAFAVLALLKGP